MSQAEERHEALLWQGPRPIGTPPIERNRWTSQEAEAMLSLLDTPNTVPDMLKDVRSSFEDEGLERDCGD